MIDKMKKDKKYIGQEPENPAQYTVEELKEEIRKSEEDITAGRVVDWEDLKKEWGKW